MARRELEEYRRRGPARTTRVMLDAIREVMGAEALAAERTALDIGGGVGAIQHALLEQGFGHVTSVDAASAYLAAARREAETHGTAERLSQHHGDFVTIAPSLAPVDLVTLDRVICCYDDMPALVSHSTALAARVYAVVFPIDSWAARLVVWGQHRLADLFGWQYRMFAHSTREFDVITQAAGLERRFYRRMGIWQVIVYGRAD